MKEFTRKQADAKVLELFQSGLISQEEARSYYPKIHAIFSNKNCTAKQKRQRAYAFFQMA